MTVKLGGYEKVLHDWKKVDEDTVGELMLKIMLERTMGEDTPYVQASTKWAGDRIVALQKGKSLTVLWMIVFRNAGAADNFAQLYSGILDKVLVGTMARKIDQRGPAVFVMIGDGAIRNHEFSPEVWKQSRSTALRSNRTKRRSIPASRAAAADLTATASSADSRERGTADDRG